MRRFALHRHSDSESSFSETDESIVEDPPRHRPAALRRRSMSRHRRSPDFRTHLSPAVAQDVRVHRSASTGGRRPREPPAAVIVDIQNDSRNKSSNKNRRLSRNYNEIDISDDEEYLRPHHRPRARSSVSRDQSQSQSRSPRYRDRDVDLVVDQRILEKNDTRQDMELMRQQQEIERLERELERRRERGGNHGGSRLLREEEEWFEDEIHDRLKKLDRLERKQWMEEERRRADFRYKMKRYEEEERAAAEREEVKTRLREEKLKELQKEKEEEEEREKMKQEIRDEEARKKAEEEEKRKKMIKMKQEAVEEWRVAEERRAAEAKREKEEKDKEFRERLRCEFGYSEEEIERILARRKEREEKKDETTLVKHKEYEKTTWIKVCLPAALLSPV